MELTSGAGTVMTPGLEWLSFLYLSISKCLPQFALGRGNLLMLRSGK